MRRRRGQSDEIIHYRAAKAAGGGTGSGGGRGGGYGSGSGGGYRPGQNVICKIAKAEPGGYSVIITKDNLPGYLPSNARHNIGDEVLATFVCIDKNRALLSERFTHGKRTTGKDSAPNWEDHLNEIDCDFRDEPTEASEAQIPGEQRMDGHFKCRRAVDVLMPPLDLDSLRSFRIADYDIDWLITQLEGGEHTGCVKISSQSRLSRGALLLYKGRCVGSIYGCLADPVTKPTEESLLATLTDMQAPDTVVTVYDLSEGITLALASLFLGYPVERHDDYSSKEYLDYIYNWLAQKRGTAALAISETGQGGTCLVYFCKGEYAGAFHVDEQTYREDREFVDKILQNDPRANLEVSILPPEIVDGFRFGFSLR